MTSLGEGWECLIWTNQNMRMGACPDVLFSVEEERGVWPVLFLSGYGEYGFDRTYDCSGCCEGHDVAEDGCCPLEK